MYLRVYLDNDWCTGGEVNSFDDQLLERNGHLLSPAQVNNLLAYWHGVKDTVVRRPFIRDYVQELR